MKIFLFCFFQFLALEAFEINIPPEATKNQYNVLSNSLSAFNSKMFEKITESENGNIIYSPLGLHMALFQVYLGALKNSTSRQELASLLQIDPGPGTEYLYSYEDALAFYEVQSADPHQKTEVRIASRMYVAEDVVIRPQFRNLTNQFLKTSIEEVNFSNSDSTVDKINNFVKNATNGLIPEVLDEVSPDTRVFLLNAIYFKGHWKHPFSAPKPMNFDIDSSTQIQVASMFSSKKDLKLEYSQELEAKVLDLPYEGETISMIIILPNRNTNILKVEKKLQNFGTKLLFEKLQSHHPQEVEVLLPKFEMSLDVPNIIDTLRSLGVNSIFDHDADLSNTSEEKLFVSEIKQKVVLKVSISLNSFFYTF